MAGRGASAGAEAEANRDEYEDDDEEDEGGDDDEEWENGGSGWERYDKAVHVDMWVALPKGSSGLSSRPHPSHHCSICSSP